MNKPKQDKSEGSARYNLYAGYYELYITDKPLAEESRVFQGAYTTMRRLEQVVRQMGDAICILIDKELYDDFFKEGMPQYDFGEHQPPVSCTFEVKDGKLSDVQEIRDEDW